MNNTDYLVTMGPVNGREILGSKEQNLNITADQVHPLMTIIFPDGRGPFQQDNAGMVQ